MTVTLKLGNALLALAALFSWQPLHAAQQHDHGNTPIPRAILKEEEEQKSDEPEEAPQEIDPILDSLASFTYKFTANLKKYKIEGGSYYQAHISKALEGLTAVYPLLQHNNLKRSALAIASGLARLPEFQGYPNFYVKVEHWACQLLQLKKEADQASQAKLVTLLDEDINWEAQNYSPNHGAQQVEKLLVNKEWDFTQPDFEVCLNCFQQAVKHYDMKNNNWYIKNVEKEIQGVQKAYPNIQNSDLQKESLQIARHLAIIPQFEGFDFLLHYMELQNRLLEFKLSVVGDMAKSSIVYTGADSLCDSL